MSTDELNIEQNQIDEEVKRIAKELNVPWVLDGVISPDHYLSAPIRTAWVLKEPNDPDGGEWDIKYETRRKLENKTIGKHKYYNPMSYVEYALRNKLVLWDDIPDSDNDVEVEKLLLYTTWINVKKSVGGSRINPETFPHYALFGDVVRRQLEIANPHIIIAAGTIKYLPQYGDLSKAPSFAKIYKRYYVNEGKIILDCYHPSATTCSQEVFCNDIICALRDAQMKGLLQLDKS